MCYLSMKPSDTFDQNLSCTFGNIRENPFQRKTLSRLDFESKGQGHSKNQKPMPWGTKNMPLSRGFLGSNWCNADEDADADICRIICRPHPTGGGGVDIIQQLCSSVIYKQNVSILLRFSDSVK